MFEDVLTRLGIASRNSGVHSSHWLPASGGTWIDSWNPSNGRVLGEVLTASREDYDGCVLSAIDAQRAWARVPAPRRGEYLRCFGNLLRNAKQDLGMLVTLETGKILSEGTGEVQEMIDMCDFATGLSRQLYGLTIASERAEHRMFEQWHPLGVVGVITAFNFPVAVWAWNAALALVCGNAVLWKPSPLTPLTAIAVQRLIQQVLAPDGFSGVSTLCVDADSEVGKWMAMDGRLPLISATGSCRMGRSVAATVAARFGRSLLELGGNNAAIVTPSADLDRTVRAVLFAAVGTAGQRCTTLRRLFVHHSRLDEVINRLAHAYDSVPLGLPWEPETLLGPLIHQGPVGEMKRALEHALREGGTLVRGGNPVPLEGSFVQPALVKVPAPIPIMRQETFAPLLYVCPYEDLTQAITWQNDVHQGLSSAIFTDRISEAEQFLAHNGSDCGIANVNIGTSGAEIGGAFGGEKETGGGREAGSDAWKTYMRRQTCTINWGQHLPLAQGVKFDLA
ncbi:MAG: aldehyde dehydrogenase family protein [Planctomycetota bacterium]|nr:aldehyde dehydrogenase family protein [Planctomycetota bacterium]